MSGTNGKVKRSTGWKPSFTVHCEGQLHNVQLVQTAMGEKMAEVKRLTSRKNRLERRAYSLLAESETIEKSIEALLAEAYNLLGRSAVRVNLLRRDTEDHDRQVCGLCLPECRMGAQSEPGDHIVIPEATLWVKRFEREQEAVPNGAA